MDAFFKNVSIFARKRREDKRIETSEIMCLLHVVYNLAKPKSSMNNCVSTEANNGSQRNKSP